MVRYTVNNNDLRNTYLAVMGMTILLFIALYVAGSYDQVGPWELAILITPWVLSVGYLLYSAIDLYLWRVFSRIGVFMTPSFNGLYAGKYWASDNEYSSPLTVNISVTQTLSDMDVHMLAQGKGNKTSKYAGVCASVITQPYLSYLYYPFSSEAVEENDGMKSLHEGFCALEFDNDHHHVKGRYFTDKGGKISDGVISMDRVSLADLEGGLDLLDDRPYRVSRPEALVESTAHMVDSVTPKPHKKKTKSPSGYSEKELLEGKGEQILELFSKLRQRILDIDDDIEVVPSKHHISFRANTPFVDIQVQKTQLKIWINLAIGELDDPREIARDVSDVKHWGSGEYELLMKPGDDIDYLLMLIKQSYRRNNL